ncbi:MAG: DNA replication initiation control protein YabA [Gammaproteobacteria bacterium]|nr:DNA replication initiation control protein YabA [Gammaproteobacteria bacterium]
MGYEITADADNFWRAGRQWHTTPVVVDIAEFTDDQWELLEADPAITIVDLDPDDPRQPAGLGPVEVDAAQYEALQERVRVLDKHNEQLVEENVRLTRELEELRATIAGRADAAEAAPAAAEAAPAAVHHPTREERIQGAIATALEADGPELRTKTGRPVLSRVREISGLDDVSSAERDAAWAATTA